MKNSKDLKLVSYDIKRYADNLYDGLNNIYDIIQNLQTMCANDEPVMEEIRKIKEILECI